MNYIKTSIILFSSIVILNACGDVKDPPNPNEEELITTVELHFTDTTTNQESVFRFADPDGVGGEDPTERDTVVLDTHAVYTLRIQFLDESKTPVEDITEEVEEESHDHLVCFNSTGSVSVEVLDQDNNGLPLGLLSILSTKGQEQGSLTVSLKHQPGVKTGSCDVGETDVEIAFPLKVSQ